MLAVLGLINLIGRVMSARAEARKRAEAVLRQSETPASPKKVPETHRVAVPAPRAEGVVRPRRREPSAVVERLGAKPAVVPPPKPAVSRRFRWTSRTLRQAFIASEILASPASSRI